MPPGPPLLISLADVGSAAPDLVGGKARGFAVLRTAGLPVPEGFVLTTAVHRAALDGDGGLPDALAGEIAHRVAALGDVPLAVRSSASAEDGSEHSHAGQFLTRLGVRGEQETLDAILACWESAADARAAAYRAHRGQDDAVHMAVIVQRLAHGEAAGVCMSCDPVTGDRGTTVVNASYGLGELIVSGLVTPDDYRLARHDGSLVAFEAGDKDVMLVMGDDGPVELEVPAHRRLARVLDDAQLAELHDGVLRCEAVLGRPADCEFSVVDGSVVWLQCRPMTALDIPEAPQAPPITPVHPTDPTGAHIR